MYLKKQQTYIGELLGVLYWTQFVRKTQKRIESVSLRYIILIENTKLDLKQVNLHV